MPTGRVQYRRLGNSGLRVSVPIIGGGLIGSKKWMPWTIEGTEALEFLKAAWDRGVNTIDTANAYSSGESERLIGQFIKKYNIPRQKIIILTKCYRPVPESLEVKYPDPSLRDNVDYINQGGLSRAAILNAVNASLARLDTPHIDLLQIHRFDPDTPAEETMKTLNDLVESGKVRYIGASTMHCWQFALMNEVARRHGWTTFVSMQNQYSLLYREDERELMAYCQFHGIGIIPWSPLAGGHLARPAAAPDTTRKIATKDSVYNILRFESDYRIIERVESIAKARGWSMAQVALAWIVGRVTSPIVGVTSTARLDEALVEGFNLTTEERFYLEELYVPRPEFIPA
ncbi:Aldo/keto reductase [Fistulina hepatica ATCC 64428]|uniref:Aldo/keto reductase n=1 Tax=Fistulina hepatica ATCC 64428 TaxID=1128425 RepID=A0A0D7AQ68_9AGAR|nr:Aldo/keto reductase [Fistulina hepatica ATCC 64428]